MLSPSFFSEFVGFTSDEVKEICKKYGLSFEECKSWYDGYKLKSFEVYNPQAVIQTVLSGEFKSYWSGTSTYQVVAEKINMNFAGTKEDVIAMLGGEKIDVSVDRYDNEYCLQSAIYLAYIYALNGYIITKEMPGGKGYADITYIPFDKSKPAFIVELKHNKSAETALTQIKEKRYFGSLSNWMGDILFVGINYDEKTKAHECKIERFVKTER